MGFAPVTHCAFVRACAVLPATPPYHLLIRLTSVAPEVQ